MGTKYFCDVCGIEIKDKDPSYDWIAQTFLKNKSSLPTYFKRWQMCQICNIDVNVFIQGLGEGNRPSKEKS